MTYKEGVGDLEASSHSCSLVASTGLENIHFVFLNLIRLKDDLIITTLKNEYLDVPQVI
jgi:hypothetical protein